MKKIIKKGMVVISIYLIAVICTLLVTTRIEELDSKNDLKLNNSLSINFSR